MAYNILGKDDENLRVTVTEGEITTINIQPASITITGSGAPVDSVNGYTGVVVLNTDDIAEGATNKYFTTTAFDSNLATKTTTDLAEGANLYYTDARVDARLLAGVPDIHADQLQLTGMPGHMTWNAGEGTVDLPLNANVTLQVGQEETHLVRNLSGTTLVNGAVVRVTGASGNRLTVTHADNLTEGTSSATIGVMTEEVGNNSAGYMTVSGLVRGLDTSAYPEGSALWLGTNGTFSTVKPNTPAHLVLVGWVVRSHATEGSIFVHVQNGSELEELHDVLLTNPLDGEALVYDAANGYWKNGDVSVDLTGYATEAWVSGQGYLTSYTETDPVFTASPAGTITNANIVNWNTAWSWGNHADAGYLTSYTETDPVFTASAAFTITPTNISNWNTAYSWGDHSAAGYLSSVALNDVTDVILTTPTVDQVLKYNGVNWINADAPAGYTDADVDAHLNTATATAAQVLSWTGTDYDWVDAGSGGASELNDLTDVTVTAPSDGDILRYNGVAGEFQNTNLGLSLTPTLSGPSVYYAATTVSITVTNWGDYDDANLWAQVVDSSQNVVVSNTQIVDNNDGTFNFTVPAIATGYQIQVKVQDFGDLASDTATIDFDSVELGGTFRYWRIGGGKDANGNPDGFIGTKNWRLYSLASQGGTAYPPNMTSNTAPAPYVASGSGIQSTTYDFWKAFDSSVNSSWWDNSIGTDQYLQIDLGSSVAIKSFEVRGGILSGWVPYTFSIWGSDTGAFAGEETLIIEFSGATGESNEIIYIG